MIGLSVVQAIVDKSGDDWKGFPFPLAFCVVASLVMWFGVDVKKGRRDALAWADIQSKKDPRVENVDVPVQDEKT